MRARILVGLLTATLALGAAGCGSKGSSSSSSGSSGAAAASTSGSTSISNTKVKFVLHAGLAVGAFHHFILLPFKAGDFKHPLSHKLTILKAALAGLFTVHELKLALADAQADSLLKHLVAPITALQTAFGNITSKVKSGSIDDATLSQADSQFSQLESQASSAGASIKEQVPSSLGF